MRAVVVAVTLITLAGCANKASDSSIPNHDALTVEVQGLDREGGAGPYVAGTSETFKLRVTEGVRNITWSATAGTLNSSGDRANWKLPKPGVATLTATLLTRDGAEKTVSWDFQIVSADDNFARAREALLATPIPVLDGGSIDATGSQCELAYDAANKVHIAFKNDTHPSLWYGVWNGTTWTVELVDGMGFDTGGLVNGRIAMVIDAANNPHLAYSLQGKGLYYATRVGTGAWTREKVDSVTLPQRANDTTVSIALNPAASNRPTIAYNVQPGSYARIVVAARTAANTWTGTQLNFGFTTGAQALQGDMLIGANGMIYLPSGFYYLGAWDGTTTSYVNMSNLAGTSVYLDSSWAAATWGAANKLIYRTQDGVFHVTLNTSTFTSSTATYSATETAGPNYGDVAYSGRAYVLHLHGSNLELVTQTATGYWSYVQLGTTQNDVMSLAVNPAGNASVCYQSNSYQGNSRVMFQ